MFRGRRPIFLLVAAALVLAVLAIPGTAAPQKQFSVNLPCPASAPCFGTKAAGASFRAVFKNETPSGNSTINSLKLWATNPLTGFQITAAQPQSGQATINGATVSVLNMSPVKPGKTFWIDLTVNWTTPPNTWSGTWMAEAWTGSSLNGEQFLLLTGGSDLATEIILADAILGCGDSYTEEGLTVTQTDVPSQCETTGVTVSRPNVDEYLLEKSNNPAFVGTVEIVWDPESNDVPPPWTQVDFGSGFDNVQWCDADPTPLNPTPICLVSSHGDVFDDTRVQYTEVFSLDQDAGFKRGGGS
jgi:hypothetical protein